MGDLSLCYCFGHLHRPRKQFLELSTNVCRHGHWCVDARVLFIGMHGVQYIDSPPFCCCTVLERCRARQLQGSAMRQGHNSTSFTPR